MKLNLWHAVIVAAVIAAVIIGPIVDPPPPTPAQGYKPADLIVIDNSYSTAEFCDSIVFWVYKFFMKSDPDNDCVIFRMSKDCSIIHNTSSLPTIEQLRDSTVLDKLRLDSRLGTRPYAALEQVSQYVRQRPNTPVTVLFITDGENDFYDDRELLAPTCKGLVEQKNLVAIAMVGVDNSLRSVWMERFGAENTSKVIIRGVSDAQDGIDSLAALSERK